MMRHSNACCASIVGHVAPETPDSMPAYLSAPIFRDMLMPTFPRLQNHKKIVGDFRNDETTQSLSSMKTRESHDAEFYLQPAKSMCICAKWTSSYQTQELEFQVQQIEFRIQQIWIRVQRHRGMIFDRGMITTRNERNEPEAKHLRMCPQITAQVAPQEMKGTNISDNHANQN